MPPQEEGFDAFEEDDWPQGSGGSEAVYWIDAWDSDDISDPFSAALRAAIAPA